VLATGRQWNWPCWPQVDSETDHVDHRQTVKLTTLTIGRQWNWPCWPQADSETDHVDHRQTVKLTMLATGRQWNWPCWPQVDSETDHVDHRQTVKLTMLTIGRQCNWPCWPQADSETDRVDHRQTVKLTMLCVVADVTWRRCFVGVKCSVDERTSWCVNNPSTISTPATPSTPPPPPPPPAAVVVVGGDVVVLYKSSDESTAWVSSSLHHRQTSAAVAVYINVWHKHEPKTNGCTDWQGQKQLRQDKEECTTEMWQRFNDIKWQCNSHELTQHCFTDQHCWLFPAGFIYQLAQLVKQLSSTVTVSYHGSGATMFFRRIVALGGLTTVTHTQTSADVQTRSQTWRDVVCDSISPQTVVFITTTCAAPSAFWPGRKEHHFQVES